jgi:hypothetical protein
MLPLFSDRASPATEMTSSGCKTATGASVAPMSPVKLKSLLLLLRTNTRPPRPRSWEFEPLAAAVVAALDCTPGTMVGIVPALPVLVRALVTLLPLLEVGPGLAG